MDPGAAKEAGMPSLAECADFVEKLATGEIPLDENEVSRFAIRLLGVNRVVVTEPAARH